jgi:hypothetical protein
MVVSGDTREQNQFLRMRSTSDSCSMAVMASHGSPEKLVGRVPVFGLHTIAVYACATHISPWLVGRWFAWFMPMLGISTVTPAANWYLQHLELVSIIPALVAGYLVVRQPDSVATWAWGIPAVVLVYKMLRYQAPSSVLFGTSMSAVRYFFEIERTMPTMRYTTPSDPIRVLAQMSITAPFYAGVAYSFGAWVSKQDLLRKLFSFQKPKK